MPTSEPLKPGDLIALDGDYWCVTSMVLARPNSPCVRLRHPFEIGEIVVARRVAEESCIGNIRELAEAEKRVSELQAEREPATDADLLAAQAAIRGKADLSQTGEALKDAIDWAALSCLIERAQRRMWATEKRAEKAEGTLERVRGVLADWLSPARCDVIDQDDCITELDAALSGGTQQVEDSHA